VGWAASGAVHQAHLSVVTCATAWATRLKCVPQPNRPCRFKGCPLCSKPAREMSIAYISLTVLAASCHSRESGKPGGELDSWWHYLPPLRMSLSKKHCRTLCAIFEEPARANIRWADFLTLCRALGADVPKPGKTAGSRQRIALHGRKTVLHKPHPEPTMKNGSVESVRAFLQNAGVTPQTEACQC
jgi:hypothetical protein